MPLKVIVFAHRFSPITETFIYHDVIALQGHVQVKVVCFFRENEKERPFHPLQVLDHRESRFKVKWRNLRNKLNLSLCFKDAALREQLQGILNDFHPDVLHFHFGIQALSFLDNLHFEGPIFLTFHGYDATKLVKKSPAYRKRLRELMARKNFYALATSASLFSYMEQYNIAGSHRQVLYSGIKMDLFESVSLQQNIPVTFTQISSFRTKKGHLYLIRAFQQLMARHPGKPMNLILAGGGPLEGALKTEVAQLGLQAFVRFPGWITQEEAVKLLASSDVFVHPSITTTEDDMESTTVAILEAMAMELPVFATRHSGIPEIIEDGVNGLLAEERDIAAYVNCMEQLMTWGRQPQNRKKIMDRFSHERHILDLLNAYRQAKQQLSGKI
ncbi:hypothetical protein CRP01_36805 [Flavilitoribacter nigricans DSM 23189 = NBRC 102662]|uniref:Glycosyltransferase n=2 Tax=Flavilitoribacter TaxID=2762562 RepID=A0A2D0MYY7_FLAN2|nr:hypothetical protein CRP01_36805 [Flavilitoribacter nigricans DSM 23189 = NBRC 102662]